eukprot:scaffold36_cov303-Chaetoceros_neogracile.AAC.1
MSSPIAYGVELNVVSAPHEVVMAFLCHLANCGVTTWHQHGISCHGFLILSRFWRRVNSGISMACIRHCFLISSRELRETSGVSTA